MNACIYKLLYNDNQFSSKIYLWLSELYSCGRCVRNWLTPSSNINVQYLSHIIPVRYITAVLSSGRLNIVPATQANHTGTSTSEEIVTCSIIWDATSVWIKPLSSTRTIVSVTATVDVVSNTEESFFICANVGD